jgi:hypothetical protein
MMVLIKYKKNHLLQPQAIEGKEFMLDVRIAVMYRAVKISESAVTRSAGCIFFSKICIWQLSIF